MSNIPGVYTDVAEDMIEKLITSLVHPTLVYAATVWSPNKRKLERIQKAATKLPFKFERAVMQREAADTVLQHWSRGRKEEI